MDKWLSPANYWLHNGWGYQKIHRVHHEYNAPIGFASHAHWPEIIIHGFASFLGPLIVPRHMITFWLWFILRQMELWKPLKLIVGTFSVSLDLGTAWLCWAFAYIYIYIYSGREWKKPDDELKTIVVYSHPKRKTCGFLPTQKIQEKLQEALVLVSEIRMSFKESFLPRSSFQARGRKDDHAPRHCTELQKEEEDFTGSRTGDMDFSHFSVDDPVEWLLHANRYFECHEIDGAQKVTYAGKTPQAFLIEGSPELIAYEEQESAQCDLIQVFDRGKRIIQHCIQGDLQKQIPIVDLEDKCPIEGEVLMSEKENVALNSRIRPSQWLSCEDSMAILLFACGNLSPIPRSCYASIIQ
ncbi:methylsterol monooxygenase 1-1-like [Olea europaea subsp. europaea]|uniref:Methylsterol monooxygenase 1-1-like n=1 Tax=Olea europaea subsp. europaea TaxID=158383 RepID=A0A8S0RL53_OLEEU|nr:methylsterol monooxygenase 1-1-like [Olea europaea subsp. europaea]